MADDSVKLFDFGLSKIVPIESRGGKKLTGQTGSLRYMAPEVCLEKPYDESADVYSFAVILWQMASHDVPFVGMGGLGGFVERVAKGGLRPPMKKSFPPSLQSTLASCWHADAAQRPSLMDAVPTLEALLAELDPSTPPPSPRTSTSYPATPSSPLPPTPRAPSRAPPPAGRRGATGRCRPATSRCAAGSRERAACTWPPGHRVRRSFCDASISSKCVLVRIKKRNMS